MRWDHPRLGRLPPKEFITLAEENGLISDLGVFALERTVREWGQPVRSWLQAGLLVTGGTDCPAVSYDPKQPLLGLWSTFSQETLAGTLMPGETIDRETALRIWTINNAAAMGQQHLKGTLEPGKLADIVFLQGNPLADITNLKTVTMTVKRGTQYLRRDYKPIAAEEAKGDM